MFVLAGCNRKQEAAKPSESPTVRCSAPSEQDFLKKTFSMADFKAFELQVPAHCNSPRLHGDFKSSLSGDQDNHPSDEAASLDVFLLDEKHFTQSSTDGAIQSVQNTNGQAIDWTLPSNSENLQKFYLLFRDSSGQVKTKVVEPNLTLSME
jgi:hypothetical protein